MCFLIVKTF